MSRFKVMMTDKKPDELAQWCQDASASAGLSNFEKGLRQDYAAVQQAIGSIWSNRRLQPQTGLFHFHGFNPLIRQFVDLKYMLMIIGYNHNATIQPYSRSLN